MRCSDCAPDSAGNRRNPAGQDVAWGRRGWEWGKKMEEDVSGRRAALSRRGSVFAEMTRGQ